MTNKEAIAVKLLEFKTGDIDLFEMLTAIDEYSVDNTIQVKGEFLFELASKQQWVNRVPAILPDKIRAAETWVWVDKNGNVFESGADFMAGEKHNTYPCKVYRLINVAGWAKQLDEVSTSAQ